MNDHEKTCPLHPQTLCNLDCPWSGRCQVMKERPIIMSGQMVRAILGGYKTQTRRLIMPQECVHGPCNDGMLYWIPEGMYGDPEPNYPRIKLTDNCPYGKPGDKLWVKETWKPTRTKLKLINNTYIRYRADDSKREIEHNIPCGGQDTEKWCASIFMFKWASRIILEIKEINVERLQNISEEDALAEGWGDHPLVRGAQILWFREFWDKHAKLRYKWENDPYVWVIKFKKI